jgi:hypothetical protein
MKIKPKSSDNTHKVRLRQLFLLVLVISPLPLFYSFYLTLYKRTTVPHTAWVSWYDNPQNEVYIGWETAENTTGTVKYGVLPDNLNISTMEPVSTKFHTVNLTSLAPDTKYYYEVEIGGEVYAKGEFATSPSAFTPFRFGLSSDTQQKFGPGWHGHTANILNGKDYSFLAFIGDFVEDGYEYEWYDFFTKASTYLDTIPIVPVQGNHDKPRDLDGDGDAEYYFASYFPQTVDNETGTNSYDTEKQFYFSFNWSSVHFQVLHFPEIDIDDEDEPDGVNPKDYYKAFTPDHLAWIEQDLANAQDMPFRVTMFHCPITGAGFYGPNFVLKEQLLPILHQYNVTVAVHGHAHHFERGTLINDTYPNNPLTYFVVGCGGGLTDIGLRPVPETEVLVASPCYTEGYATATTLTFTTYTFEGAIIDTITFYA